ADLIVVKDLANFEIIQTYINGKKVAEMGKTLIPSIKNKIINNFRTSKKQAGDFQVKAISPWLRVIKVLDGQLITHEAREEAHITDGLVLSNISRDLLKIAVVNRYLDAAPALAFIKNFGLQEGALASSVGHDSHNIIAVGVDDKSLAKAVNLLIGVKGGISAVWAGGDQVLPLPVGGIMSPGDGYEV